MTPTYDAATGRLRLSIDELVSLHNAGADRPGGPTAEGDQLLAPALQAIGETICTQTIRTVGARGSRTHWIWLGPDTAAAALQVRDESYDLFSILPAFAPALVARLLRLEPRPRLPDVTVELEEGVILDLVGEDRVRAEDALGRTVEAARSVWGPWAAEVERGAFCASLVGSTWLEHGSTVVERQVASIDTVLGMVSGSVTPGRRDVLRATTTARHWTSLIESMSPPEEGGAS